MSARAFLGYLHPRDTPASCFSIQIGFHQSRLADITLKHDNKKHMAGVAGEAGLTDKNLLIVPAKVPNIQVLPPHAPYKRDRQFPAGVL